jgi:hypothetical protein
VFVLGGAGGQARGTLAVTPGESLTVIVGQKGSQTAGTTYGGGGAGPGTNIGASGGGRTAIQRASSDLATAGGGGGFGRGGGGIFDGGAGGGTTGSIGGGNDPGRGGTQSAGGAAGGGTATAGSSGQGGNGDNGGGGGGGYYGGGGGWDGNGGGAGGGGSSYIALMTNATTTTGGGAATDTNGSATITYSIPTYRPGNLFQVANYAGNNFIIDPLLNVGINVTSINSNFQLDVNGAGRAISFSTLTLNVSSINGQVPGTGSGGITTEDLISTTEGFLLRESVSTGQGIFSSVTINMLPQDAPFWDARTYPALGFDPEPSPLALDIFGSARILKNLYIGSTTTVIGTAGIAAPQVSSANILTSSLYMYNPATDLKYPLRVASDGLIFNGSNLLTAPLGINPQLLSTPSLVSTTGGLTSTLTSSITNLFVPYSTLDRSTYFQVNASTNQLFFGTYGPSSQIYIGDLYSQFGNASDTTPLLLIQQKGLGGVTKTSVSFAATGADQFFTVPYGVTSLDVTLLGAGGGNSLGNLGLGGSGGLVSGKLAVTPGSVLTLVVGKAGVIGGQTLSYGGGGISGGNLGGSGGGRSAIRIDGVEKVTAGAGGGGGYNPNDTGGNGGGLTGGITPYYAYGRGGTQSAGGEPGVAGGIGALGTSGSAFTGGNGIAYAWTAGAGGGYYGGGGGTSGGGGSSYVDNLTGTVVNIQGAGAPRATDGSIQITYGDPRPGNILEIKNYVNQAILVDPFLNMGINVSSIVSSFQLDVNGDARAVSLSSLNLNVSTINRAALLTGTQLVSSTGGLQREFTTAGFLSTLNLTSTVTGLGSAGFLSTLDMTSTVTGLGSIGYLSSFNALSMSTGQINTSTLTFVDINTQARQVLLVSSGTLTLNGQAIGGGAGGGSGLTISDYVAAGKLNANQTLVSGDPNKVVEFATLFDPQNWYNETNYRFTPTIAGYYMVSFGVWFNEMSGGSSNQYNIQIEKNGGTQVGLAQIPTSVTAGTSLELTKIIYMNGTDYLRFTALQGTGVDLVIKPGIAATGSATFFTAALLTNGSGGQNLLSTVANLGSAGYVSTLSLLSTTAGLQTNLISTTGGLIEVPELVSTTGGITRGYLTSGYLSTLSLISTTRGLQDNLVSSTAGVIELPELVSTTGGLQREFGTAGFLSSLNLLSTTGGLQREFGTAGFLSSLNLLSTTGGLQREFGTAGFLSSPNLLSTTGGLQREFGTAGFISTLSLISTTSGLQTSLFSTTAGLERYISSFIDPTELQSTITSTVIGVGQASNFISTTVGLGSAGYISSLSFTSSLISTTNAFYVAISSFSTAFGPGGVSPLNLVSTTGGLQRQIATSDFISSPNLISTTGGLQREFGTAGFLSSLNLLSSVQGLGSIGYVSTQTLVSTVTAAISSFSTAIGQGGIASIPANLSTFAFFTSSILASTTVTRILSTQQAFTSSMTGTTLQFVTLSSQALFVSSFFTATVTATPMFITF